MTHGGAGSYLAIDLGASSGRAVVGTLNGATMSMREIHRFRTPLIEDNDHLYWDIEVMWSHIRDAVSMALAGDVPLRSISVDSWAVDYVPLGADGIALRNPYSYRDPRTAGLIEAAIRLAGGADALYERTGIQFLTFNTLPQILADMEDEPSVVRETSTRLLMAEYFLYRLSGIMVAEATMASTTQLMDARTVAWSAELLEAIGDDVRRWPRIVPCGTVLGPMRADVASGPGASPPVIIATCAHDTAAAVAAVPASGERPWAFISSGTWSLVGAELDAPILTREAREAGFTNEAGLDGTVRFLINRTGMWVLEECRREWEERGTRLSHEAIVTAARETPYPGFVVNLNAPAFGERGGMPEKLSAACIALGHEPPDSPGAIGRLVFESIAASNAAALDRLDGITGLQTQDVHVVGGGALNDFLNQLTADRSGRRVLAGPEEATVLGNLLVQARTLGDLPPGVTIRDAARQSAHVNDFLSRRGTPSLDVASSQH